MSIDRTPFAHLTSVVANNPRLGIKEETAAVLLMESLNQSGPVPPQDFCQGDRILADGRSLALPAAEGTRPLPARWNRSRKLVGF
jgi:hypothetical protein